MEAVAREAGVAVQTVYFVFHTKAAVLMEALKAGGAGPREEIDVSGRPWMQEALDTSRGGARRLALVVEHGTEIYRRLAPIYPAISAAASVDPDVRDAWAQIVDGRRAAMRRLTQVMHDRGELRESLGVGRAADIMSAVHRHETFLALTDEAGWSIEAYKAWIYLTLTRQLLTDADAASASASGSDAMTGLSFATTLDRIGIG